MYMMIVDLWGIQKQVVFFSLPVRRRGARTITVDECNTACNEGAISMYRQPVCHELIDLHQTMGDTYKHETVTADPSVFGATELWQQPAVVSESIIEKLGNMP